MSPSDQKVVQYPGEAHASQIGLGTNAGGRWEAMRDRDEFAVTLLDGRRVIGRQHDRGESWSIYVYPPDSEGPLLGYASASTRTEALREAGLSGDDAGETLGRAGI
jgi:hypothetical protein